MAAPVREHTEVRALAALGGDEGFELSLADGSLRARNVVIATGPFQLPRIPALAHEVPRSVMQLDPTRYRRPEALPEGAVLVVGSGASGTQIADELLRAGRRVYLSVSRHRRVPRRFRGKDAYWWFEALGRFAQTIDTFPERQYPPSTVVTGVNGGYDVDVRKLAAAGAKVIGRVTGASGGESSGCSPVVRHERAGFAVEAGSARRWAPFRRGPSVGHRPATKARPLCTLQQRIRGGGDVTGLAHVGGVANGDVVELPPDQRQDRADRLAVVGEFPPHRVGA